MSEQVDRKDLKIQALLEKVSSLTMNYENQIADLRVNLTVSEQTVKELRDVINNIHTEPVPEEEPPVADGGSDVPPPENPSAD